MSKETENTLKTLVAFYKNDEPSFTLSDGCLNLRWKTGDDSFQWEDSLDLQRLTDLDPKLGTYLEPLFALEHVASNGRDMQAWLRHWHAPGLECKKEGAWRYFIADLSKFEIINAKNSEVVVYTFSYKVLKRINSKGVPEEVVFSRPGWITLSFDQLSSVFPGASEKLVIGQELGISHDELFDYVTKDVEGKTSLLPAEDLIKG